MKYLKTETGDILTRRQLKAALPNVSLGKDPGDDVLAPHGYARIEPTERPEGDVVTEGAPEQGGDGVWRQTWNVRAFTNEERAEQLKRAKRAATRRINDAYQSELDAILADYPDAETKTWDKQEQEARAYAADSSVSTPLLGAVATARNMDKAELVGRVIAKADAWIALSGAATGKRQKLVGEIDAATTIEEVEMIQW